MPFHVVRCTLLPMAIVSDQEIDAFVEAHPGWGKVGDGIARTYELADFNESMGLVDTGRPGRREGRSPSRHRHPLEQGHPDPLHPFRGRGNRQGLDLADLCDGLASR